VHTILFNLQFYVWNFFQKKINAALLYREIEKNHGSHVTGSYIFIGQKGVRVQIH